MPRIVVVGAGGMLGTAVAKELHRQAWDNSLALTRAQCDILSPESIESAIRPDDIVINCAGAPNRSDVVNSQGPKNLTSYLRDGRLFHVSTDCVFSGALLAPLRYYITHSPDAVSGYGVSKIEGERVAPNTTNIRTSFVGIRHGLYKWFYEQPDEAVIPGYTNAYWTGSTADKVAKTLVAYVLSSPLYTPMEHLATRSVLTKYDLLCYWRDKLNKDIEIISTDTPHINRALMPTIELESVLV